MLSFFHTLTTDGSVDFIRGVAGVGIVIQESARAERRGQITELIAEGHTYSPQVSCEALAILRGLEHARVRGLTQLKVRCDYSWLRRTLQALHTHGADDGGRPLHASIMALARTFSKVEFKYVPRRKNQIAHRLAREGRLLQVGTARIMRGNSKPGGRDDSVVSRSAVRW